MEMPGTPKAPEATESFGGQPKMDSEVDKGWGNSHADLLNKGKSDGEWGKKQRMAAMARRMQTLDATKVYEGANH